jgi:hypothetical protein
MPYDLVFDVDGQLARIQVKSAWFDAPSSNYIVDNRRTKTNRRVMLREHYQATDFDFAAAYIEPLNLWYVFPVEVFVSYRSEIHVVEADKRQRKPRSAEYREAWQLIWQWAVQRETSVRKPVKFGEAVSGAIPSQASEANVFEEGVET